jgi:hypothetical protein
VKRTKLQTFALGAVLALLPLLVLWWFSVDCIVEAERPLTSYFAQKLMPIEGIVTVVQGGWLVRTGDLVAGKALRFRVIATLSIDVGVLRRLTLAWPLFLALILAPPRPPALVARIVVGLMILVLLFIPTACAVIFLPLVNNVNFFKVHFAVSPIYGDATVFLAKFALHAALYFSPLLAPPLLWLALNPTARALFLDLGGAPRNPRFRSGKAPRSP